MRNRLLITPSFKSVAEKIIMSIAHKVRNNSKYILELLLAADSKWLLSLNLSFCNLHIGKPDMSCRFFLTFLIDTSCCFFLTFLIDTSCRFFQIDTSCRLIRIVA